MELKEAVCVVTGGGKGLGKFLCKELSLRGATVVIGDIDIPELQCAVQELGACGQSCDVREGEQVKALAEETIRKYGRIDVWINNAGIWMPYAPAEELDFVRMRSLMEVNFFGLAHGTVEAIKRMRAQGRGAIVNILSVRALKGQARAAAYSASKFAAEGFTQAVRSELEGTGVRVIGVYPYRMKTELFGDAKHADYDVSMEPAAVARMVIDNLADDSPSEHLEIWSESDVRTHLKINHCN